MGIGLVRKWTDAGAPVLTYTSGSLVSLLEAVLVDGYGAFSGLGWTMPYKALDGLTAVYRSSEEDGHGCFYQIVDDTGVNGFSYILGYEQMSNVTTGILPIHDEAYRLTGYNHLAVYGPSNNSGSLEWIIIGDNRGVFLCFRPWKYSTNVIGEFNWLISYIGDYIPFKEDNHWTGSIFSGIKNAAPAISTAFDFGNIKSDSSVTTSFRVARDNDGFIGSVSIGMILGYSNIGSNYLGGFLKGFHFCLIDDPIQISFPVYISSASAGPLGKVPGLRGSGTAQGLDGIAVVVTTDHLKVYKELTYGGSVDHFFPFISNNTGWPNYLVIQSGEGFRNALA